MLKKIFILINVLIITVYSAASLTTYLSNKGEERSYKIYESAFHEMQEKLEKKDSLTTVMSEKDIKSYSKFVVESEKEEHEEIKPRFMKIFNEKTIAFSKELAKKKVIRGGQKSKQVNSENKEEEEVIDKNTMNAYLEEARDDSLNGNNDELYYFFKRFADIKESFGGYKIKTKENLFLFFSLWALSILSVLATFVTVSYFSDDIDLDTECITIVTYCYLFLFILFYISYLLANWLFFGV